MNNPTRSAKFVLLVCASFFATGCLIRATKAKDDFETAIKPFLEKNCAKCHGKTKKPKGNVDLNKIQTTKDFLGNPELIGNVIDALDSFDMPPESEPKITDAEREKMIGLFKSALAKTAQKGKNADRVRRLNRFQYNNSIKDIFGLRLDVFALPEKLMTRHSNYIHDSSSAKLPDSVNVASHALNPIPGLRSVRAFPKDLRAAHGFDNQSNQLTLSPLLLDAFLRLSVSIVESPDFNKNTVGMWSTFFEEPKDKNKLDDEIRSRIRRFLNMAFRRNVDEKIVGRYSKFAFAKLKQGMPFTDVMKKVSSAALSSPMFLYRYQSNDKSEKQFEVASRLSYLLWASCPDKELLQLAADNRLEDPNVLNETIERMLVDPKIERFLDTFPAQWMQLENVLAATPDPQKHRFFSLDKNNPASLQMLLEPLLLFDAVFVENRPIIELVKPDFAYQSDFLKSWYTTDLKYPKIDTKKIADQNNKNNLRRTALSAQLKNSNMRLTSLIEPIREKLLADKQKSKTNEKPKQKPIDLKPIAAWEFNGNFKSSMGGLDLVANGKTTFKDGMVTLNQSYLISKNIPVDLKAKTLEVWCVPHNLDQIGGGVMGIQGEGDFFDTIVLGERKPRHWISGSNGFARTLDFAGSTPEPKANEILHLVMVYKADGTTLLYRNGKPYGKPFKKGRATFPKHRSQILFGLRHLPAGGNRYLNVSIDKARLYDRALTSVEVVAANSGQHLFVSGEELEAALTKEQKAQKTLIEKNIAAFSIELKNVPANRDVGKVQRESRDRFDNEIRSKIRAQSFRRVKSDDPRYGGVITNAAVMSMTSGPKRTHPIARGAWIIEVIFNDPPPPPPNDVPPLNEDSGDKNLTIREKFKVHRSNPDCAGCHSRLDPLGFAMENFDITGRWRDKYENGRGVDMSGTLMKRYAFNDIVEFKKAIVNEEERFAKAFSAHLLRFALARELSAADSLTVDAIVEFAAKEKYRLKSIIKSVIINGGLGR